MDSSCARICRYLTPMTGAESSPLLSASICGNLAAERHGESGLGLAEARERHRQDFTDARTLGATGYVHVSAAEATGLRA